MGDGTETEIDFHQCGSVYLKENVIAEGFLFHISGALMEFSHTSQ